MQRFDRRWRRIRLALALWLVGGTWAPGQARNSIAAPGLRVATFNVQALSNRDGEARFFEVALALKSLAFPEVVALQELADDDGGHDGGTTSASATSTRLLGALAAAGGPAYDVVAWEPADGTQGGPPGANIRLALLTTLPVLAARPALSAAEEAPHEAFMDSRTPLFVRLSFAGGRLDVLGVHLSAGPAAADRRAAQASALARFVGSRDTGALTPLVVLGDFNATPLAAELAPLRHVGLRPVPQEPRPTHRSGATFDHLWVSPGLEPAGLAQVSAFSIASDHAPVFADLLVVPGGNVPEGGCQVTSRPPGPACPVLLLAVSVLALGLRFRGASAVRRGFRPPRRRPPPAPTEPAGRSTLRSAQSGRDPARVRARPRGSEVPPPRDSAGA